MTELEQDKLLLAQDILKVIKGFLDKYNGYITDIAVGIESTNATMTMNPDGKCRTGRFLTCQIDTQTTDDYEDEDD